MRNKWNVKSLWHERGKEQKLGMYDEHSNADRPSYYAVGYSTAE